MKSVLKEIENGGVTAPEGFTAGAVYVGVKSHNSSKPDVALLISDRPAACAALFTKNKCCAAPVIIDRSMTALGTARGAVLNSGNANVCTGQAGIDAAMSVKKFAEDLLGFGDDSLFICSTGVIGEPYPAEKVKKAVSEIVPNLSKEGAHEAARAIMTTDMFSKEYACELELSHGTVRIGAMAKGSGMVHPDMGTILCFITTDAFLDAETMHAMLSRACELGFNSLTVDGDTSTNDTLLMFANGASGVAPQDDEMQIFEEALTEVILDMTRRIARDGEGACKMITVRVSGTEDDEEARRIARKVAASDSVKTALGHGGLTTGLVLSAAGSAESNADFTDVRCSMETDEDMTTVDICFNGGSGHAEAYGCDLNNEYIRMNAFYKT